MSQETTKVLISAWFSDDKEAQDKYISTSGEIYQAHGIMNVSVYQTQEVMTGDANPHAVVMLEWENAEQFLAAYNSAEYQALLDARAKAFTKLDITILAPRG